MCGPTYNIRKERGNVADKNEVALAVAHALEQWGREVAERRAQALARGGNLKSETSTSRTTYPSDNVLTPEMAESKKPPKEYSAAKAAAVLPSTTGAGGAAQGASVGAGGAAQAAAVAPLNGAAMHDHIVGHTVVDAAISTTMSATTHTATRTVRPTTGTAPLAGTGPGRDGEGVIGAGGPGGGGHGDGVRGSPCLPGGGGGGPGGSGGGGNAGANGCGGHEWSRPRRKQSCKPRKPGKNGGDDDGDGNPSGSSSSSTGPEETIMIPQDEINIGKVHSAGQFRVWKIYYILTQILQPIGWTTWPSSG